MSAHLSPESAAVAAERYAQARCGLLSTVELGRYIDGLFDEVTELLGENTVLRSRLQQADDLVAEFRKRDEAADRSIARLVSERDEARTDLQVARCSLRNLNSRLAATDAALHTAKAQASWALG